MSIYNFERFDKQPRGRKSGDNISVSGKNIMLWNECKKLRPDAVYVIVYIDKLAKAIGLKFCISQEEGAFFIKPSGIYSKLFESIENGKYCFREKTNEGIDVFIKS